MPHIDIPDGGESIYLRVFELRPDFRQSWLDMRQAVYEKSILSERESEGARSRIAIASGCIACQVTRHGSIPESFYQNLLDYKTSSEYSDRERLCIEFAERFSINPQSFDKLTIVRLREHFSDAEIVDLAFCCARHIGFGRFGHALGLDDTCEMYFAPGDT